VQLTKAVLNEAIGSAFEMSRSWGNMRPVDQRFETARTS
jgi:hypothetical protein